MERFSVPPQLNIDFYCQHAEHLCASYQALFNRPLLTDPYDGLKTYALFEADFALLSHGIQADPIFNFANRAALDLFEYSWDEFIQLPSRLSAKPLAREARQQLLETVNRQGYIDNYSGIRVSASGKEFMIENAVVWNIVDKQGVYCGQAARIDLL